VLDQGMGRQHAVVRLDHRCRNLKQELVSATWSICPKETRSTWKLTKELKCSSHNRVPVVKDRW
jgi:hypothetical protein